jgi:hypothetical protein
MIMPTTDDTLSGVAVAHRARRLPQSAVALPTTMATTAASEPNSASRIAETEPSAAAKARASSPNARCWLA